MSKVLRFEASGPGEGFSPYRRTVFSFFCEICHQPGESLVPRVSTHDGACRREKRRRFDAARWQKKKASKLGEKK